jgi:hypothetical protein
MSYQVMSRGRLNGELSFDRTFKKAGERIAHPQRHRELQQISVSKKTHRDKIE